MTPDINTLWQIFSIDYTAVPGQVVLTVQTDFPCHLFMRWTLTEFRVHREPGEARGDFIYKGSRYCVVEYEDNEQEEAGDTTTHTFIKPDWPFCQTRWFYFWGTRNGQASPSESCVFSYHNASEALPTTAYFYPDPVPVTTTLDGNASRLNNLPRTWARLHDLVGTSATMAFDWLTTLIECQYASGTWVQLSRSVFLFNTASLPDACSIIEAKLRLFIYDKSNTFIANSFTWNIFTSNPASNITLQPIDYQCLDTIPLSTGIPWSSLPAPFNSLEFTLNSSGLDKIDKAGITKLGIREASYDAPNISPSWQSNALVQARFCSSDYLKPSPGVPGPFAPRLEVTYV